MLRNTIVSMNQGKDFSTTYGPTWNLMDALRSNPLYQNPRAICQYEHVGKYRRIQLQFDPVFAKCHPGNRSEQTSNTTVN